MAIYAKASHKRAAKVLGYALTVGGFDAWRAAGSTWIARLDDRERAALAYTALRALDPEVAEIVVNAILDGEAGQ